MSLEVFLLHQKQWKTKKVTQWSCNTIRSYSDWNKEIFVKELRPDPELTETNPIDIETNLLCFMHNRLPRSCFPDIIWSTEKHYAYEKLPWTPLKENNFSQRDKKEQESLIVEIVDAMIQLFGCCSETEAKNIWINIYHEPFMYTFFEEEKKAFFDHHSLPLDWKNYVQKQTECLYTNYYGIFGLIHADLHHQNILVENKKLSWIIDFGDARWWDITRDFCIFCDDYPACIDIMTTYYNTKTGNYVSAERIRALILVWRLSDIRELRDTWDKNNAEKKLFLK